MIGLRFFPFKSADVRGAGTHDKPLRTSAWEASAFGPSITGNPIARVLNIRHVKLTESTTRLSKNVLPSIVVAYTPQHLVITSILTYLFD